jgi:outer membrane receptor protein involved in Fe transport
MVTYFASATATSAKTAYFQFREPTVVTASASATATSSVSQSDAYNIALKIAQQIADSTAENQANIMMQSVNISTMGEPNFGLE